MAVLRPNENPVDLSEFDGQRRDYPRKLEAIIEQLDDERRAKVLAALADPRYSARVVAKVLKSWGYDISDSTVFKWRANYLST